MDFSKLAKVLALAASDNESEATHALRAAKRLLENDGADFVELSRRLAEGAAQQQTGADKEVLEDAIFDLRNEIRRLRSENERLKQGFAAGTETTTSQDAGRAETSVIRLRAEVEDLRDALKAERTETLRLQAHEATLHQSFQEAMTEAGKLSARLTEAENRRMRLEAENRRLTHANHALSVELEEVKTQQVRFAAELIAHQVRQELSDTQPKAAQARKGKGKGGASQYALL